MTRSDGQCRIDGLEVLEVEFDFITSLPRLSAKYAYVNSTTGERLGSGHRNQAWSAQTLELLEGLKLSMERDVTAVLFSGENVDDGSGAVEPTSDGVPSL